MIGYTYFFLPILLGVLLTACVQTEAQRTMRVHNSSGYSVQPSNSSSTAPSSNEAHSDEGENIADLEDLAKKDPQAAYDLGIRFFRGDGVRQDSYRALQWMRDAAERGDLDAQKAVGRLYLTGLDEMGEDPREAEKWLTIAASQGDQEAERLLKEATKARRNDADFHRWKSRWQPVFYRAWHSDYSYKYYWRGGYWRY